MLAAPVDHLLDKRFGNGGAGGEDDGLNALEPLLLNVCRRAYEVTCLAVRGGDLREARAVGALAIADDEYEVRPGYQRAYGGLPIRGRVADVSLGRPLDIRVALSQRVDDFLAVFHAECRLGNVCDFVLIDKLKLVDVLFADDELDVIGAPPDRADGLVMSFRSD